MSTDEPRQRVEDEENFAVRQRLKAIVEARDAVDVRQDDVEQGLSQGQISREESLELLFFAVRRYLARIEPLLTNEDLPQATHVYEEAPVGTLRVDPPEVDVDREKWRVVREPEPIGREFSGLREVLEFEPFEHQWQVPIMKIQDGYVTTRGKRDTKELSRRVLLTRPMLLRAVRLADEFLEGAGVGLELGEDSATAESDYSDVVEVDREFAETHE